VASEAKIVPPLSSTLMRHVTLITTGGTIEKTYDEATGSLENRRSIVRRMLTRLRLEDTAINIIELLSKDSLLMTDEDRGFIIEAIRAAGGEHVQRATQLDKSNASPDHARPHGGIVVLHGTDTLELTGEAILKNIVPTVPIILTGAMRPYEMQRSDALQNLTESIFATEILPPGVYCVAHGRALPFPGVKKDRTRATFI